jgi:hypothetical protein
MLPRDVSDTMENRFSRLTRREPPGDEVDGLDAKISFSLPSIETLSIYF